MKVLNITHTDLDGVGCSLVLQYIYGKENVECQHTGYGKIDKKVQYAVERIKKGEDLMVFITDICFKKESGLAEEIDKLNQEHGKHIIQVIDHHATSSWINNYSWGWSKEKDEEENKICGTKWTYEGVFNHVYGNPEYEIPFKTDEELSAICEFTELVNEWDTWRWVTDYPEDKPNVVAKQLNMLLSIYGVDKFKKVFYTKLINRKPLFDSTEQLLLELKQNEIDEDVNSKNEKLVVMDYEYTTHHRNLSFINDYIKANHLEDVDYLTRMSYHKRFKVGITFAERNISEVGNELGKLHPELDFIMIASLPSTVSFRTVKNLPVPLGIIANDMTKGHGGGHPQSAGGVLQPEVINDIIRTIIY